MDEKINNLFSRYEKMNMFLQETIHELTKSVNNTKFKKSGHALLMLLVRSGYLTSSILEMGNSRNIYSAGIILRSLVEHTFRHLYIYTRALTEDSDTVGVEYYTLLRQYEDKTYFNKIHSYINSTGQKSVAKLQKNQELENVNIAFSIKQIFSYITNNTTGGDEVVKEFGKEYFVELLALYSNLSPSVHGGPYSEVIFKNYQVNPDLQGIELVKMCEESLNHFDNILKCTYLFAFLMNQDFESIYKKATTL